jgi:hypothetical protein
MRRDQTVKCLLTELCNKDVRRSNTSGSWFQKGIASIAAPILELLAYRAVYKRFSGEEW